MNEYNAQGLVVGTRPPKTWQEAHQVLASFDEVRSDSAVGGYHHYGEEPEVVTGV